MTACFVGADRTDVLDRIGTFLAVRGGDVSAEEMLEQRRASWLAGTVDEVASGSESSRRSESRASFSST